MKDESSGDGDAVWEVAIDESNCMGLLGLLECLCVGAEWEDGAMAFLWNSDKRLGFLGLMQLFKLFKFARKCGVSPDDDVAGMVGHRTIVLAFLF